MQETVKLYDEAPYETSFNARVLYAENGKTPGTLEVILDRTLFFPEEGGQTCDTGTLEGYPVTDVQISEGIIRHTVALGKGRENEAGEKIKEGMCVHGALNWEHRFYNMQHHSGEHILSGLLHSLYGYENVGFHLTDHTVTLDTGGHLNEEQVLDLERRANEVVFRNAAITCRYPSEEELSGMEYRSKSEIEGPVRIVTIEGVDRCACCAPHVARTGEVGLIRIVDVLRTKTDTRLTIVCGRRAVEDMQIRMQQLKEISRLTNLPQENASAGVVHFMEEIARLKEELRVMTNRYIDLRTGGYEAELENSGESAKDIWAFEEEMDPLMQRNFMNRLLELPVRFAGVFAGNEKTGYRFVIGSRSLDANLPGKALREKCGAKCGGKPVMIQGSVLTQQEEILKALEEIPE